MNLDYDDLDRASQAHDLLRRHKLKATLFPNKSLSTTFRRGQTPKIFHRVVVTSQDADTVNELLKAEGLEPSGSRR